MYINLFNYKSKKFIDELILKNELLKDVLEGF